MNAQNGSGSAGTAGGGSTAPGQTPAPSYEPLSDDPGARRWHRPDTGRGSPLAAITGVPVADDASLEPWEGPRNAVGARYFRCYLQTEVGRTSEPVLLGLHHRGPFPGNNWVEVIEFRDVLTLPDGRSVEVAEGIERRIFAALAGLVPPGGHLMAEYESPARSLTARALALGVPPVATPLGATLRSAGCGAAFRDWYIPEGGREGPRKLQGFRPVDADHERRRAAEMVEALKSFLADERDLDWDVLGFTRPIARAALEELAALAEGGP